MSEEKKKEKLYKKWWFWLIILGIALIAAFTSIVMVGFFLINPDRSLSELTKNLRAYHKETTVYQSYDKNVVLVESKFENKEDAVKGTEEIGRIIGKSIDDLSLFKEVDINIYTIDGMKSTIAFDISTRQLKNEKTEVWVLEGSSAYEEEQKKINELKSTNQELENKKMSLNNEIEKLKEDIIKTKGEPKTYPAGQLTAGVDVPTGKYKIYGGNSNFIVHSSYGDLKVNIILGGSYGVNEYIYTFQQGDKIDAKSSFSLIGVE